MGERTREARSAALERQLLSNSRYVPALLRVEGPDGEWLYEVGGCWDTVLGCYVDRKVEPHVFRVRKSQVESARAIGRHLELRVNDDDTREALMLLIGNRGGGKTVILGVLFVSIALALPGAWQMGVSITSKQNRELKQAIKMVADPAWLGEDTEDPRDPRSTFVTRSTVLWLTARNPAALRQALMGFEHVAVNEGQDQAEQIFVNAIGACRSGGLMTVATNPPTEDSGDWTAVLHQSIKAGTKEAVSFELKAEDNDAINQETRRKGGRLLQLVNPDKYAADFEGVIKLSGTQGYPGFTRQRRVEDAAGRWVSGHVGERGAGWTDVTRLLTAEHTGGETGFDYVGGCDFQTDPGSCASIGKLFRTKAGELILWIKEFVGTPGTEQDLTIALNSRGYYPGQVDYEGRPAASLLLVGDATGARQNAEHRKRDPYSFTRLRADGWSVLPPAFYGAKKTPWNPLVPDSRKQMKALALVGAVVLSAECAEPQGCFPSLLESFIRAKVTPAGKFEKKGHLTHGPDGVRYLAWRFLARPQPPAAPIDVSTAETLRGLHVLSSG